MMPQIGLGVYKVEEGRQVEEAINAAFKAGYRAIDTAAIYGNEEGVGRAIADSGLPREELFITTKLWNDNQGFDTAKQALDESLAKLGLEYIDLYLIHWPKPSQDKFIDTWKALEDMYHDGKARAIGVSNFHEPHLDALLDKADVVPAVNQIELHPMLSQVDLRAYCEEKGIVVESWSPLMQARELLDNPVIMNIAKTHHKQPAQVVLRWHIQHDLIVIPKSVTPARIKMNVDIFNFSLSHEEMQQIDSLNVDNRIGPHPERF